MKRKLRLPLRTTQGPSRPSAIAHMGDPAQPLFSSTGFIDLLCGGCQTVLARNMFPGQMIDLALSCAKCGSWNDVPYIPAIEALSEEVFSTPDPQRTAAELAELLRKSQESGLNQQEISVRVGQRSPALSRLIALLVPKDPTHVGGYLAAIFAGLQWWAAVHPPEPPHRAAAQEFLAASQPLKEAPRNQPCPCGTGKKYKHCHGKDKGGKPLHTATP